MTQKLFILLALHVRAKRRKPKFLLSLRAGKPFAHRVQHQHTGRKRGHQPKQRRAKVCLISISFAVKFPL